MKAESEEKNVAVEAVPSEAGGSEKGRIRSFISSVYRKTGRFPVIRYIILAIMLCLIVEMLGRRSPAAGAVYMVSHPVLFLYNALIILMTLSITGLFRKKRFVVSMISLFWLMMGLTNCIMLGCRTTPFNFMDFRTFKDVIGILTVYFSPWQLVLMFVGIVLFVMLLVLLFVKSPKEKVKPVRALASVAVMMVMVFASTTAYISNGILATTFHNIHDAYQDYGFAYCFACSVVGRGISEPSNYSQEAVDSILNRIEQRESQTGDCLEPGDYQKATVETPNIIVLQLESFFDPNHLKNVTYSKNPVPYFTYLKDNFSSGYLLTPSFGAGTSNTEFEVLTGMSMDYFGPGEYPYTTILRKSTDESAAYDLKSYGYSTHAIHDHTGKFYGRYLVYPELGFDSFTSVEYMQNVQRNPLNWADDSCLTGEIVKAVESTDQQDFVFAVSVQGHGKYPDEQIDDTQTITSSGFNEEETVGFDYYLNQIYQMDQFLQELTTSLEQLSEPTVLVIYGDHLPKFSISSSDLDNNNQFETEYVIWNNFGLKTEDEDLTCYQLYPHVMKLLGMDNGVITGFQQHCTEDDTYYSDLRMLQYDILYGNCYAYGGENPFVKTDMQMGIDPITISSVKKMGDYIYLKGGNFTSASTIFINGDELDTSFVNSGLIIAEDSEFEPGDLIEVIQMSSRKTKLSSTGKYYWYEEGLMPYLDDAAGYGMNYALNTKQSEEEIYQDILAEEDEDPEA